MITNNVTRLLDGKKIKYTAFELPAEKLGAENSAQLLGVPADMVFKTIVTKREQPGKYVLAVVPGSGEVDLKLLAKVMNEKKMQVTTQAEAEKITGLLTGGISPLALINKGFQVVIDESALKHEQIHISGGQRGLNIRLKPGDLIDLTHARTGVICKPVESE
jgi:Cys-tRNA(Pro)/Cys-tRNA(Cys) deacylase